MDETKLNIEEEHPHQPLEKVETKYRYADDPQEELEKPRVKKPRTEKQISAFQRARETKMANAKLRKELKEQAIYERLQKQNNPTPNEDEDESGTESEDSIEYISKRKCVEFEDKPKAKSKAKAKPKPKPKPKAKRKVVVYLSSSSEDESESDDDGENSPYAPSKHDGENSSYSRYGSVGVPHRDRIKRPVVEVEPVFNSRDYFL